MEPKHIKSIEGDPRPNDIFQPHRLSVELFDDMDEIFNRARRMSAGEQLGQGGNQPLENIVEGQRGVAIVTPGRLIMLDPCPKPGSVAEEKVAPMREMMPPDPPLAITVIGYTFIEALVQDIDRAIPFRGFINAWAYLGHNVIVFEGHDSAFESGIRNSDVLLVDSGMVPFLQSDWVTAARPVMNSNGRILVHDRETYTISVIATPQQTLMDTSLGMTEERYVQLLLTYLIRGEKYSVEINSGELVPDLADLTTTPTDLQTIGNLGIDRNKLNADKVIDLVLHEGGWRWYNRFKTTSTLRMPIVLPDGRLAARGWEFKVRLGKNEQGKTRLQIDR